MVQSTYIFLRRFQCFVPPVLVHYNANYTLDIHYNLPINWLVYNIPSGYMDDNGWLKFVAHFFSVCGSSALNPLVIVYDVHNNHFYDIAIDVLLNHHIQPFNLKVV